MDGITLERTPTVGVICELNPLHNGHVYLLSEARRLVGRDGCVVCVMSGRSTQRGECAVAEPYARGHMAIAGGADLVVELPFPWSSGSAEAFARAGIHILASMGVGHLLFGSECGDISLLERMSACTLSPIFAETYASLCREGRGTASAFAEALASLATDQSIPLPEGFPSSNDLLGIAYLSSKAALGADGMVAHTVKRRGQDYRDELLTDAAYPSATSLRLLIREAACDPDGLSAMLDGTMPEAALSLLLTEIKTERAPVDTSRLYAYYHTYFRMTDGGEVPEDVADMGGGLWGHLHRCALSAATPDAFMAAVATKQYTHARLRRGMLFSVTGITEADMKALPTYTHVLAANERGRAYLAMMKKAVQDLAVQVVTKPADAPLCRQRRLCERMDRLFTLCMPEPREAGWLMRQSPRMI